MIRTHKPFDGKRFIEDTSKNIVHDQVYEKKNIIGDCKIDEIKEECIRTFSLDTLERAKKEGYKPCKYCLFLKQSV
jgi:hypothetical protein